MNKDYFKIFLWVGLFLVGFLLYGHWQKEHPTKEATSSQQGKNNITTAKSSDPLLDDKDVSQDGVDIPEAPNLTKNIKSAQEIDNLSASPNAPVDNIPKSRVVNVKTDVFDLDIDLKGGDIVRLNLLKYPKELKKDASGEGFSLFANTNERYYIAQSGLLSNSGPDSKTLGRGLYKANKVNYKLEGEELFVDLFYLAKNNVSITKRFIFTKNSHLIKLDYIIHNKGANNYQASLYGRIKRKPVESKSGFMGSMRTYTGAALKTLDKNYYKISFKDMSKKAFDQTITGGWAGMVEHYFTSAWVPDPKTENTYSSEVLSNNTFGIRFVSSDTVVYPGEEKVLGAELYAGPEITDVLKNISPGLELTVDYGILWPICQPIFWLLKTIFKFVGNWGVAIILTTLVIKLLFFKLSAASYRSMGNMRKLQPMIDTLKKRYEGDKQAFGQAVMAMYKKEKVNPLGGCLPILVQIPVFIALYYVLLESVELRHAPFALWINDLSVKDPFYVLPIIMGLSMIVQQKLSPAPPDPVQAKVMMLMPIFFTFLFLQFPSGLVLYWVVNNGLSILQQWIITKKLMVQKK